VFVAVPLPEPARAEIEELVGVVRAQADPTVRDVRWVRLDGLHLTLRFIGPVDGSTIAGLADAVDAAAALTTRFEVTIAGAGAFPSTARPRTIWLGVDRGAEEMAATAERVQDALATAGVARSERPFRAHLTLARADGIRAGSDVARRLIDAAAGRRSTFAATELVLFETIGGGGPARYAPLHTAPLNLPGMVRERDRGETSAVLPSEPSVQPRTSVDARRKELGTGT
jgi:RNA 2',3'-cyclic 3'-phosphodiesterase